MTLGVGVVREGWTLVETLEADRYTVVARGQKQRERTSLERVVGEHVSGGKGPLGEAARWISGLIGRIREHPVPLTESTALRNGEALTARLLPVLGPHGSVHGVHLRLSAMQAPPTEVPASAFGLTWDSKLRLAEIPRALASATPGRTRITAPEVFRFIEPVDLMGLFTALLSKRPGEFWSGPVELNIGDSKRPAQLVMTSGATAETAHLWRGLLFETAGEGPRTENLQAAALAAIPRLSNMYMCLSDVVTMRVMRWITDPISDVQWKGMVDQRDTPHPDDTKMLFEVLEDVFLGRIDQASIPGIRLRRRGGGWVIADLHGALIRTTSTDNDDGPMFFIVQYHVTGYSDEPDPVPPTDTGHPVLDDPAHPRYPLK